MLLGTVAMNALLCVPSAARRDMSRLALSITKRIRNSTNVSARRAGSGRDPVPADPPPQSVLIQSHQKTNKDLENQLEKVHLERV